MNSFRGMVLRTDPNYGVGGNCTSRIVLLKADEIVMSDGAVAKNWPVLSADISRNGVGGLDTGSPAPTSWYQVIALRNSLTDARALILHRHMNYGLDQQQASGVSLMGLGDAAMRQMLAQGFKVSVSGNVEIVDMPVARVGSPNGNIWFTIEADSGGYPSGTPLATSDKIAAGSLPTGTVGFNLRAIFRSPTALTAGVQYWYVGHADYPIDGINYVQWYSANGHVYANGSPASYNGTIWTANANDMAFKLYVTQNTTPLVIPSGYDQQALLGFFYINGNKFDPMALYDRKAFWLIRSTGNGANGFEGFSNTMPLVRDANILFPHGLPIIADVATLQSGIGAVVVAGLPEGYGRGAGNWDNAVTGYGPANQYVFAGRVATEYGGLYVSTSGGTAIVMVPTFEW